MNPKNPQAAGEGLRERIEAQVRDVFADCDDGITVGAIMQAIEMHLPPNPAIAPGGDNKLIERLAAPVEGGDVQKALMVVNEAANDARHRADYARANGLVQARITLSRAARLPAAGNAGAVDDATVERAKKARDDMANWRREMPAVWYGNKKMEAAIASIDELLAALAPAAAQDDVVEAAEENGFPRLAASLAEPADPPAAGDDIPEIRKVAKRNLRSLIERSTDSEKDLMLRCLEELS